MKTTLMTARLLETLKNLNWKSDSVVFSSELIKFSFDDSTSLKIIRDTNDIKLSLDLSCDCTDFMDFISDMVFILNLKQLFKIVKKVKSDQITFDFIDNKCQLSFGSMKAKIDIFDIDLWISSECDFPLSAICGLPDSLKVQKAIKHILPFTGQNEVRRSLMGINFNIQNKELHLIGANAFQIQKNKLDAFVTYENTSLNFTLPNVASKVLSDLTFTSCEVFLDSVGIENPTKNVQFTGYNFQLICRVLESEYPNLDMLYNHNCTPYSINTKELLTGIDSLLNFLDNDKNAVVKLSYENGNLVFSSQGDEFSFTYSDEEKTMPEKSFSVGLNCYFFRESLKHNKHNDTLLVYNLDAFKPFLFENESGDQVNVLMPVKIKW